MKQINYAHIDIFHKKGYWFKVWIELLRPLLARIELICQQPTMPQLRGVQGVYLIRGCDHCQKKPPDPHPHPCRYGSLDKIAFSSHPIAHLWGQSIGILQQSKSLFYILSDLLQCRLP